MSYISFIFSAIALSLSVFLLLEKLNIVKIVEKQEESKYSKFRNKDGYLVPDPKKEGLNG
jgi:hypothetical protein